MSAADGRKKRNSKIYRRIVAALLRRTAQDNVRAALEDGTLEAHFNVAVRRDKRGENEEEKNATQPCKFGSQAEKAFIIEVHQLSSMKGFPSFFSSRSSAHVRKAPHSELRFLLPSAAAIRSFVFNFLPLSHLTEKRMRITQVM